MSGDIESHNYSLTGSRLLSASQIYSADFLYGLAEVIGEDPADHPAEHCIVEKKGPEI